MNFFVKYLYIFWKRRCIKIGTCFQKVYQTIAHCFTVLVTGVRTLRGHSITTWTTRGGRVRVSRKSTLGHVTKGRHKPLVCVRALMSTMVHSSQNLVKFGPRSCWMRMTLLERWSNFSFLFIKVNALSLLLPFFLVKLIGIKEHSFWYGKKCKVKFMLCKKFTKNHEIFTFILTFTWVSVKSTVNILLLFRKHELYELSKWNKISASISICRVNFQHTC